MELRSLISKYSQPGPRYTSYPTTPQWSDTVSAIDYEEHLRSFSKGTSPLSLYAHIPFCESLCYYCGCNIKITKDHSVSRSYVNLLIKEIELLSNILGDDTKVGHIAWGGGTPTFLSSNEMRDLKGAIDKCFTVQKDTSASIEIDPRVTRKEQLETLKEIGFTRVSIGVQDFDEDVQRAVNRKQSVEMTENLLSDCRALGFSGINFDLIYGLAFQTVKSFDRTLNEVIRIRPDRIALYNYARLPDLIRHQSILEKYPMPSAEDRIDLFLLAYNRLTKEGYCEIGMDHFAVDTDELFSASNNGQLFRNFQGYSVKNADDSIGVGVSAIGEVANGYFQNMRDLKEYSTRVGSGQLATMKGLKLSKDDLIRKWVIQALMCRFEVDFNQFQTMFDRDPKSYFASELIELEEFESDGILTIDSSGIRLTSLGRLFIRNVAMAFDVYLKTPQTATYSRTV